MAVGDGVHDDEHLVGFPDLPGDSTGAAGRSVADLVAKGFLRGAHLHRPGAVSHPTTVVEGLMVDQCTMQPQRTIRDFRNFEK